MPLLTFSFCKLSPVFLQNMEYKCPHYCRCSPANFYIPLRVKVSCEESSMMALPEVLPENTVELNVSYNKVRANLGNIIDIILHQFLNYFLDHKLSTFTYQSIL